jgi:hypothetical protein
MSEKAAIITKARGRGRPFVRGRSGNPAGRPPGSVTLQRLARRYTGEAVEGLVRIMREGRPHAVQVAAISLLLDRLHEFSLDTVKMFHRDGQAAGFKL